MTLEEIRELIKIVRETGVAELELQRGNDRVKIRLSPEGSRQEILIPYTDPQPALPAFPRSAPPAPAPPAAFGAEFQEQPPAGELLADPTLVYVKAPIVGTFYDAASPTASPFVGNGDPVQPGQVLCIIESMKLMNEIESEVAGVVVQRFVENARPVEYGETLFAIKPS